MYSLKTKTFSMQMRQTAAPLTQIKKHSSIYLLLNVWLTSPTFFFWLQPKEDIKRFSWK